MFSKMQIELMRNIDIKCPQVIVPSCKDILHGTMKKTRFFMQEVPSAFHMI